jgi:hypothetical protein
MISYAPKDMLLLGLEQVGFDRERVREISRDLNLRRFKAWYVSMPHVCCKIFEDLQATQLEEAFVPEKDADVHKFLAALNFLKTYTAEEIRSGVFKMSEKAIRQWSWYFVEKIQAMKGEKVSELRKTVNS